MFVRSLCKSRPAKNQAYYAGLSIGAVSRSQLQWGKRKTCQLDDLKRVIFSCPGAGIVALSVSDVVLLRRRSVL